MKPISGRVADHLITALKDDDESESDTVMSDPETVAELGALSGMVVGDRFVVQRKLGSGATGDVYEATDRETQRSVALKLPNHRGGRGLKRFAEEARASAMLSGAGFARFIAEGTADAPFLATELATGETLRDVLARGPLPPRRALFVVRRLAGALAAMHARSWAHRDVKPSNVVVSDEEVKLIDFGISRDVAGAGLGTRPGDLLGTLPYMAPEQLSPKRASGLSGPAKGFAIDVFALGAVFYECLTGKRAFPRDKLALPVAGEIVEASPRIVASRMGISAELAAYLARMIAPHPKARPRDGAHVLRALLAFDDGPLSADMALSEDAPLTPALAAALDGSVVITGKEASEREALARSVAELASEVRLGAEVVLLLDADLHDRRDLRQTIAAANEKKLTLIATSGATDLPMVRIDLGPSEGSPKAAGSIDALAAFDRWVLRLGAALGETFVEALVTRLVDGNEARLVRASLARLVECGLLTSSGGSEEASFAFTEPGVREAVRAASRASDLALARKVAADVTRDDRP